MNELTLFDLPVLEAASEPEPVLDEARLRESFAAFRAARHKTLSYGLGIDSTDILLEFLRDPVGYGLEPDLSDPYQLDGELTVAVATDPAAPALGRLSSVSSLGGIHDHAGNS